MKAAPVIEGNARIMVAKAARSTEISAPMSLTERDEAARPEVADATTDAMTTGAEAVTLIARIIVTMSDAMAAIRAQMKDAAVAARMTAMMMDAHGLRRRVITRVGGLRSAEGAGLRARTCAAAIL